MRFIIKLLIPKFPLLVYFCLSKSSVPVHAKVNICKVNCQKITQSNNQPNKSQPINKPINKSKSKPANSKHPVSQ
jgi:hypothetical protein